MTEPPAEQPERGGGHPAPSSRAARPHRPGLVTRLRQRLSVWLIKAAQRLGPRSVRVLGRVYRISPHVFNPKLYGTSRFMARHIRVGPDDLVLDMGTGSGIQAVVAAQTAATVVALDDSPHAARCARTNAEDNGVGASVLVVLGDLFAPLAPAARFDLILFTPPYFEGTPTTLLERALLDPGKALLRRFLAQAKDYLAPGGCVQMVYSSLAEPRRALAVAEQLGWRHREIARKRVLGETLLIYKLTPRQPRPNH